MQIYGESDVRLAKKWSPLLSYADDTMESVKPNTSKAFALARMLENTKNWLGAQRSYMEATPTSGASNIAGYDNVMLGLVRRVGYNLLGNNLVGIQPMTGPTGLVFALRPRYNDKHGAELHAGAPNTTFTGRGSTGAQGDNPASISTDVSTDPFSMTVSQWHSTAQGEGDIVSEISATVDSVPVQAKTRTLKANFSIEMAQDLASQHGVDANSMFNSLMANQISAEINYETLRLLYVSAILGCEDTLVPGTFDLNNDADGSWIGDNGRVLMMRINYEASKIMQDTRLGHGSFAVVDPKTFALLANAGYISDAGPSNTMFSSEDQIMRDTTIAAGVLKGGITVYRDDYATSSDGSGFIMLGWRGAGIDEAAQFYAPYVPLWTIDAVDPASGQPIKLAKTRAGRVAHPLADTNGAITPRSNPLLRIFKVEGLQF